MAVRYVTNADGKGWLKVRYSKNSTANTTTYPPLPQFLRVNHQRIENGRDYFVIMAGRNKGKQASVKLKTGNISYLSPISPFYTASAVVKFDITKGQLWYGDQGPVTAEIDSENPIPKGIYDLEIPYEPHIGGARYREQSKYVTTWFRIGHTGDRFLHPGERSAGCVTVTDIPAWTRIYEYLIRARKNDKSVGTIEVLD